MENLPPTVVKNVLVQLQDLVKVPVDGVSVILNEQNLTDVRVDIQGPTGTPYEGGLFKARLVLGADFPASPPKGYFLTKIFHPNVSESGEICVNTLKRDWTSATGLRHIFTVIRCLLIEPNPESALNEEAGKLLLDDYEEFAKRAKIWTEIHASNPNSLTEKADPAKKDAQKKKKSLRRL